jgi:hypothetical protein
MRDDRPESGTPGEEVPEPGDPALDALAEAQRATEAALAETDARIEELGERIEETRRALWGREMGGVAEPASDAPGEPRDGDDGPAPTPSP